MWSFVMISLWFGEEISQNNFKVIGKGIVSSETYWQFDDTRFLWVVSVNVMEKFISCLLAYCRLSVHKDEDSQSLQLLRNLNAILYMMQLIYTHHSK